MGHETLLLGHLLQGEAEPFPWDKMPVFALRIFEAKGGFLDLLGAEGCEEGFGGVGHVLLDGVRPGGACSAPEDDGG